MAPSPTPTRLVRLVSQLLINGCQIVGSDTCSWDELHDGRQMLRLRPSDFGLPEHVDIRLEVRVENIATVESLETRVQALERAIDASHILSRASRV
jgi:hypothetical protein